VLFLLFRLGKDRYAIEAQQVVEVLPLLELKRIPQAPASVRGAFDYRGQPVPLLDLSQVALGRPAPEQLSTRIVLVNYPDGGGGTRLLGLLAEHVTETLRRNPEDFQASGVELPDAPWLGPVASDPGGLVQWVQVGCLLPDELRALLFPVEAA
jgi:chemotaxis-related protein WspB